MSINQLPLRDRQSASGHANSVTGLQQVKVTAIGDILMATASLSSSLYSTSVLEIESKLLIRYPSRADPYPWPVTVDLVPNLTHN